MIPLIFLLFFRSGASDEAVKAAELAGRVLLLSETDGERIRGNASVPPGMAPILTFRYIEGTKRGRFGDLDLVVDDAGH